MTTTLEAHQRRKLYKGLMAEPRADDAGDEAPGERSARPATRGLAGQSIPLAGSITAYGLVSAAQITTLSLFLVNAVHVASYLVGLFFIARAASGMAAGLVTGWSAGPKADPLLGQDREAIISRALQQFARITGIPIADVQASLEGAHFHDWHADPFARGAYSYAPAGELPARSELAEPVSETLYFCGEATETNGHSGTVHGAIATGVRAAAQVLAGLR